MNSTDQLHHEKLEVYQASIVFLSLVSNLEGKIPRGHGEIKDQLKRASLSITLNIAEGYGKKHLADKLRFFDIARGSSHESGALFDVCNILKIISDEEYRKGKNLLYRIVCMLVKLCQSSKLT